MVEELERRELLAASLSGGVLTVRGDSGSSVITVAIVDKRIVATINGAAERFTNGSVTSIQVIAYSGNDSVDLSGMALPSKVTTGDGNDNIVGTSAADRIDASSGADQLYAGPGDDRIDGGPGSDLLCGQAGIDTVDYSARTTGLSLSIARGGYDDGAPGEKDNIRSDVEGILSGAGDDTITGYEADDVLSGGDGDDEIVGDNGDDTINGDNGNDFVEGNDGHDRINGGNGNDYVEGGDDSNILYGGSGNDILDARNNNLGDGLDGGPGYDEGKVEYGYEDEFSWEIEDDSYTDLEDVDWYWVGD